MAQANGSAAAVLRRVPPPGITRDSLRHGDIFLVKVGTEVITDKEGHISMGCIGSIAEQISRLRLMGKKVVVVTSGAVSIGRVQLRKQYMLSGSLQAHMAGIVNSEVVDWDLKACAAAGQSGMQRFYETLFAQYDVACAQILVTDNDFRIPESRRQLRTTLNTLLDLGILPIINENDVISTRVISLVDSKGRVLWDNDSLAGFVASELGADLILNMTDIDGFHSIDSHGKTVTLRTWTPGADFVPSKVSRVGPEGQRIKIKSMLRALKSNGVKAVMILDANDHKSIERAVRGEDVGTLLTRESVDSSIDDDGEEESFTNTSQLRSSL